MRLGWHDKYLFFKNPINSQLLQKFTQLLIEHLLCARLQSGTADGPEKKEAEIPVLVELTLWGGTESILTARIGLSEGTSQGVLDLPSAQPLGWGDHSIPCKRGRGQDDSQTSLKRQTISCPSWLSRYSFHTWPLGKLRAPSTIPIHSCLCPIADITL